MSVFTLSVWLALGAGPALHASTEPDGLDLLVVELPTATCSARLVVRAGAGEDPKGKNGLAHAVEHLALGGPKGRSAFLSSRATINAFTDAGGTVFTLETSAENCADQLQLLLGVVTEGKLRPSWFDPEMEVIRREVLYRVDRRSILDTSLFGNTAEVVAGTPTTRDTLRQVDVVRFFGAHYVPHNMALVVVGPLTPAAVRQVLAGSFRLAPSLPEERPTREATKVLAHGESKVFGMRPGLIALATALPMESVQACRSVAALLEWRLLKRLVPGTTDLEVGCLSMQGNLILAVMLATVPDDEERVRTLAVEEWRKLADASPAEKELIARRVVNENKRLWSDSSQLADQLAGSATWLRGDALFALAPAWWAALDVSKPVVEAVRATTTSQRSCVFSGAP